jgi:hypothetical protein
MDPKGVSLRGEKVLDADYSKLPEELEVVDLREIPRAS